MGIPLGDRIKLLKAISLISSAETGSGLVTANKDGRPDSAERRQVTVMFCDLVGSTALSVSMDPEDLRGIISAYQKYVAETVDRYGGFVAKYMVTGCLFILVIRGRTSEPFLSNRAGGRGQCCMNELLVVMSPV
jgi:hypothetical protein